MLISQGEYTDALSELTTLIEVAPKEGMVHLTMGKLYKKLGRPQEAVVHLTRALDLSPKDSQQIKAALLNLQRDRDDETIAADEMEEDDEALADDMLIARLKIVLAAPLRVVERSARRWRK